MAHVTVFGTGAMAKAIGGVLAAGGSEVQYIAHEDAATARIEGDLVVLAVPHPALAELAAQRSKDLAGRTVVDITNPLDFSTFDGLVVPAGSSAAAELQAALPHSQVLKAFNTNFAATLTSGRTGDATTTVLIAGDDSVAKAGLQAAVEAGGLTAVDAGSLRRAHELEALGLLQLTLAVGEKIGWTGGFALVP
ncbi:MAG: NAD(P)-binding domain-containing protein [Propionibacteriaceae bacterium]|nr:NAD(P)-binding domain-containing protein [Propionibacteriaceae bacterium]